MKDIIPTRVPTSPAMAMSSSNLTAKASLPTTTITSKPSPIPRPLTVRLAIGLGITVNGWLPRWSVVEYGLVSVIIGGAGVWPAASLKNETLLLSSLSLVAIGVSIIVGKWLSMMVRAVIADIKRNIPPQ